MPEKHRLTLASLPGGTGWTGRCACGSDFGGPAYSRSRVEDAFDRHLRELPDDDVHAWLEPDAL